MSTQQNPPKNTEKKISESEELKTEPMSEKDEVKAAEQRMAEQQAKDNELSKEKGK